MTTTNYDWLPIGCRPIPEWPAYVMTAEPATVWRVGGVVRCKGGGKRQNPAKQIKQSDDGRVYLCQGGKKQRFNVRRQLYPAVFPDLVEAARKMARQRPQYRCRRGHPLIEPVRQEVFGSLAPVRPEVAEWGTGNRICLWCNDAPETFPNDNTYSLQYGIGSTTEYFRRRLRSNIWNDGPQLRDGDRLQLSELEWGEHGFRISASP